MREGVVSVLIYGAIANREYVRGKQTQNDRQRKCNIRSTQWSYIRNVEIEDNEQVKSKSPHPYLLPSAFVGLLLTKR